MKKTKPLNIILSGNYIDFSDGSANLRALEANYAKDERYNNSTIINYTICSQTYGNIADINKVVTLDANLKAKLIAAGIDTNNDSKITR